MRRYVYLAVVCASLVAVFWRARASVTASADSHLPSRDAHVYDNTPRSELSDIARRNAAIVSETEAARARHQSMLRRHFETNLQNHGNMASAMATTNENAARANSALLLRQRIENKL